MTNDRYIAKKLKEVAQKHFSKYSGEYQSFEEFRETIETCYCLVANKTATAWVEYYGVDQFLSLDRYQMNRNAFLISIKRPQIPSRNFSKAIKRLNKRRIPYIHALDAMEEEKIISRGTHYCVGKFSMQVGIHNHFLDQLMTQYLQQHENTMPISVHEALHGYYPNRLLQHNLKTVQKEYRKLGPVNGIELRFPDNWNRMCSPFGWFTFDQKLTIDNLLRDIITFKKQYIKGYSYGRFYYWFTNLSKAFREYLWVGSKRFREIVDCHSGFFWMSAIKAFKENAITKIECLKMFDQCFSGNFYSEIGKTVKTQELKRKFMQVINTHRGQLRQLSKNDVDNVYSTIINSLKEEHSSWWKWIEERRIKYKGLIGLINHVEITNIEKDIMKNLSSYLINNGYTNIHRVHDAIYGIDDVDNISEILKDISVKYIDEIEKKKK